MSKLLDMKNSRLLFPHRWKRIGILLTSLFVPLGLACQFFELSFSWLDYSQYVVDDNKFLGVLSLSDMNFTNEFVGTGIIVGLLLWAFSKEKFEDEQIATVRLESLQWSIYWNYAILILGILFVHGTDFLLVMTYNMFTTLFLFLIRFHIVLYRQKKENVEMI